jgi:toxin CptA
MRNAPSVLYPVGRCAFYARWLVCLGLLGLVALLAGGWYSGDSVGGLASRSVVVLSGAGLWLLWAGFAWWGWRRAPTGLLQWDALAGGALPGAHAGAWRWRSEADQEGAVLPRLELMLDLQTRVLLRLHLADRAGTWVWLERDSDPARWDDLRRALVATP